MHCLVRKPSKHITTTDKLGIYCLSPRVKLCECNYQGRNAGPQVHVPARKDLIVLESWLVTQGTEETGDSCSRDKKCLNFLCQRRVSYETTSNDDPSDPEKVEQPADSSSVTPNRLLRRSSRQTKSPEWITTYLPS